MSPARPAEACPRMVFAGMYKFGFLNLYDYEAGER